MKLTQEEKAALDALSNSDDFNQDARYRDSAGRTLTEIQQAAVSYKLDPKREGLMAYDNPSAEKYAKINDPRYTLYYEEIKDNDRKTPKSEENA